MRIVLFFSCICILSIFCIPRMKTVLLPEESAYAMNISFSLPNSTPQVIEREVTSRLESVCSELGHLKHINSTSGYGYGSILLQFDEGVDLPFIRLELAGIIRRLYPSLPDKTSYPLVSGNNSSIKDETPLLVYNISAPLPPDLIWEETAPTFKKVFAGIKGIGEVAISGANNKQLVIAFDDRKCKFWNITEGDVMNVVQAVFRSSDINGAVSYNGGRYFISLNRKDLSVYDLRNIIVSNGKGEHLALRQIADIYFEEAMPEQYFRINGDNAITLKISSLKNENKIRLSAKAREIVNKAIAQLPAGYKVKLITDSSSQLKTEINKNYKRAGFSILILFVFILFAYRSLFYLLNLMAGLVVSSALALLLAWIFDINIHLYTIAGFAIAFGIMLDNSIVMTDHYHRFNNRRIIKPLIASTFTSIAVLSISFFLPEEERRNIWEFALMIILSLVSSLMTACLFIPALYDLLRDHMHFKKPVDRKFNQSAAVLYIKTITAMSGYKKTVIVFTILLFGIPVFMLPPKLEGTKWYQQLYNSSIGSALYYKKVHPYVSRYAGGTFRLFMQGAYEHFSFSTPAQTALFVNVSLPVNNSIAQLNDIMTDLERYLSGIKGIEQFQTLIEAGPKAVVTITFSPGYKTGNFPQQLQENLKKYFLYREGMEWMVHGTGEAFGNAQPPGQYDHTIEMSGYNYEELDRKVSQFVDLLHTNRRVNNISAHAEGNERMEYILRLDPWKMQLFDISSSTLQRALYSNVRHTASSGNISVNGQNYQVIIKGGVTDGYSPAELLNTQVINNSGGQARIYQMGGIDLGPVESNIIKRDKQYIRKIGFNYIGSPEAAAFYTETVRDQIRGQLPLGYYMDVSQHFDNADNTDNKYYYILYLLAVVFLVCCVLFENFHQSIVVIFSIIISFIGIFLTYATGDFYFDQGGFAAFILLGALVANASILLVNDLNNARSGTHNERLIKAVFGRSRTIILTTVSSCCGLVPFIAGTEHEVFWYSLAVAGIGGLIFSLFSILIILPVILWKKGVGDVDARSIISDGH